MNYYIITETTWAEIHLLQMLFLIKYKVDIFISILKALKLYIVNSAFYFIFAIVTVKNDGKFSKHIIYENRPYCNVCIRPRRCKGFLRTIFRGKAQCRLP